MRVVGIHRGIIVTSQVCQFKQFLANVTSVAAWKAEGRGYCSRQ